MYLPIVLQSTGAAAGESAPSLPASGGLPVTSPCISVQSPAAAEAEDPADLAAEEAKAKEHRRKEMRAQASTIDFDDLKISGGCTIDDTALRAISLDQLELILTHAARRLEQAPWKVTKYIQDAWTDDYMLSKLEEVTLYDLNQHVVLLSTVERQCSMVELLAIQDQQPDFFVSHWQVLPTALLEVSVGAGGRWGEPIELFSLCLRAHRRDLCLETPKGWYKGEQWGSNCEGDRYGTMHHKEPHPGYLGGRSPLYWVCAHANNRELLTSSKCLIINHADAVHRAQVG